MPNALLRLGACLGTLLIAGCTTGPETVAPSDDPLVYDAQHIDRADRVVVFVPGALTSINMFGAADGWAQSGFAAAYFRLPGLDGRLLDGPLRIEAAARQIADFANAHPKKDLALVGYSSGAPIVLRAASQITEDRTIPVVAISPAVERAGGLPTALRGAGDLIRATRRAGSLDRLDIWIAYWHILLYGRAVEPDPAFRDTVIETARAHRGERPLGPPDRELAQAHTYAVRRWELPEDLDLTHIRLRVFAGREDPVFSTAQTLAFARKLGLDQIHVYPGGGHLIYVTQPDVFDTAREFAVAVFDQP